MEQSRLIFALVLSFAVFFVWNLFFSPKPTEKEQAQEIAIQDTTNQAQPSITQAPELTKSNGAILEKQPPSNVTPARNITVETPLYIATLSEKGAAVLGMTMKKYRETVENDSPFKELIPKELTSGTCLVSLSEGQEGSMEQVVFASDNKSNHLEVMREPTKIKFSYTSSDGVVLEKAFHFNPDSYLIDVTVSVRNGTGKSLTRDLKISLYDLNTTENADLGFIGPSALIDGKLKQIKIKEIDKNLSTTGNLQWIALEQPYFMSSLVLKEASQGLLMPLQNDKLLRNQMVFHLENLNHGDSKELELSLFMGPKSWSLLRSYHNELNRAIYFGWVDILAKPCLWFMNYVYQVIPNYGIAIIILTIITRLAFWPLAHKSYKSMNDMRKLQPLMQEIREKYKNDKARINQETMALYRTYKINPMGGCLPMVVQLPVFFALYRMLYSAIELRHAPFFGWINDLSAPDRLFSFGFKVPFMNPPYGIPILTLIMGATMLLQQKMTPTPGDPAQAKMMMFMPVIFTVIFINFSSGLVLYWLVGNIISISQQYFTQKRLAQFVEVHVMIDYAEFEGKNLEKALEIASKELKIEVSTLKYDVVSHGSSGIFGLVGVKKAKIRVQIPAKNIAAKIEPETKNEVRALVQTTFEGEEDSASGEKEISPTISDEHMEQAISAGKEALTRLVQAISDDAVIEVEHRKDRILFKVDGGNCAVLIGKRGQTLEAIQYLVEKIANKKNNSRIRVLVDVKGYLGARKTSLRKLATKMAEKAKKTNRPVTMGQMNAYDRRIVHMSLKDNSDVRTQSMGEGYYRKLVIFPKRGRGRRNSESSQ